MYLSEVNDAAAATSEAEGDEWWTITASCTRRCLLLRC